MPLAHAGRRAPSGAGPVATGWEAAFHQIRSGFVILGRGERQTYRRAQKRVAPSPNYPASAEPISALRAVMKKLLVAEKPHPSRGRPPTTAVMTTGHQRGLAAAVSRSRRFLRCDDWGGGSLSI